MVICLLLDSMNKVFQNCKSKKQPVDRSSLQVLVDEYSREWGNSYNPHSALQLLRHILVMKTLCSNALRQWMVINLVLYNSFGLV